MEDDIKANEWISMKEMRTPAPKREAPKWDKEISQLLGMNVPVNSKILIRLYAKWAREERAKQGEDAIIDYLADPEKVKELKTAFNVPV